MFTLFLDSRRRMAVSAAMLGGALVLGGCATSPTTAAPVVSKIPATYDYEPAERSAPASAGTTVLLVSPQFAPDFQYASSEIYRQFAESMAEDFEEMLTARGFTVLGPFDTYDEVVFSAKDSADLLLSADLDIEYASDIQNVQTYQSPGVAAIMLGAQGQFGVKPKGNAALSGKVTLQVMEPTTQEKLWVKSVPVPSVTYPVESTKSYPYGTLPSTYMKDAGFHNPTVKALQEIYGSTLDKSYAFLEPRELQLLKPQAQRIKSESRFVK